MAAGCEENLVLIFRMMFQMIFIWNYNSYDWLTSFIMSSWTNSYAISECMSLVICITSLILLFG